MAASAFSEKTTEPTMQNLYEVLEDNAALLKAIEEYLLNQCGEFTPEWKFYGKQAGWTIAYRHKKRRIFHLIPQAGLFTVVFVLGKRAVSACRESTLPESVISAIDSAHDYVEGRSVRLDIRAPEDVETAKQLVSIKMAH